MIATIFKTSLMPIHAAVMNSLEFMIRNVTQTLRKKKEICNTFCLNFITGKRNISFILFLSAACLEKTLLFIQILLLLLYCTFL